MTLHTLKVKVAGLISHPVIGQFLSRIFSDQIPSRGLTVDTSCPLVKPEIKALLFWRLYESAEIRFIRQYLRADLDVIELGGSLGVVTCQIRKRIGAAAKIICVEANPILANQIDRNLKINALDNKVSIIKKAIDYKSSLGSSILFDLGENNTAGRVADEEDSNHTLKVKTTTLSQIVDEYKVKDYVLVSDIEGAEASIALREKEALKNCRQIIIELHPTKVNDVEFGVEQMCRTFTAVHGFTLRARRGPVCVFERI